MPGAWTPLLLRLYPSTATTKTFGRNNFLLKDSVVKGTWQKGRWDKRNGSAHLQNFGVLPYNLRSWSVKAPSCSELLHCCHSVPLSPHPSSDCGTLVCDKISTESHIDRILPLCSEVYGLNWKKVGKEKRRKVVQCKAFFFKREIAEIPMKCIYIEVIQKLCTD